MTKLLWDQTGERLYETGVDHGVLYLPDGSGEYVNGYAWNGLTAVTESPSGAESNKQYADNQVYLNLQSAEEFNGTIEAFTYPDEFAECNGEIQPQVGVYVGQQTRKSFGFSYRTKIGNDTVGQDYGYKLHLVYGALAGPSEKQYNTINESPEATPLSWEISTTPVAVNIGNLKPTATITINSTHVGATQLAALEDLLYGTEGTDPRLPLPAEVIAMFAGSVIEVTPTMPTFASNTITIPSVTGVIYMIQGEVVPAGPYPITQDTIVHAKPAPGYSFPAVTDEDWLYDYT